MYEPGTFDNETEKYIIYNVSKVEYETCRITNANPRIIAICDKPQKLMYFTITFRPFTPQPGGLEFLPGNDYYFICKYNIWIDILLEHVQSSEFYSIHKTTSFYFSFFSATSSKDDLHRRIGGRCSTNNMKVVFKVCCAPEAETQNATQTSMDTSKNNNTVSIEQLFGWITIEKTLQNSFAFAILYYYHFADNHNRQHHRWPYAIVDNQHKQCGQEYDDMVVTWQWRQRWLSS